jgi:hypothetical protein
VLLLADSTRAQAAIKLSGVAVGALAMLGVLLACSGSLATSYSAQKCPQDVGTFVASFDCCSKCPATVTVVISASGSATVDVGGSQQSCTWQDPGLPESCSGPGLLCDGMYMDDLSLPDGGAMSILSQICSQDGGAGGG